MFKLEHEGAGAPASGHGRDLSVEATIIDIQEITAPSTDRDPLRGLRRAVAAHSSSPPSAASPLAAAASDPVGDLAEALAEVLEGTRARVVVRTPHEAAAAGPTKGRAAESFVLRGRSIVIKGPGREDEGVIIDPLFREAFRIAPATPGYQRLVEALPETFVGDTCALRRLVALVTAQAARSYEMQGLTQPPWRRYSAMMARWLPHRARYTDTVISPPASPLKRLDSDEAAALAFATAQDAVRGAFARLAAVAAPLDPAAVRGTCGAAAPPARVVVGFDLPAAAAAF